MAAEWDKATALQVNLKFKYFNMVQIKLRQLGVPNLIVDNSNSDANEFGQRNPSHSKSKVAIVSNFTNIFLIKILIKRSKILTLKSIKFD